jgi:broad specificity phosphatase PhoE
MSGTDNKTRIILVRHGHVEGILPERFRGRRDVDLSEPRSSSGSGDRAANRRPVDTRDCVHQPAQALSSDGCRDCASVQELLDGSGVALISASKNA